MGRAGVIRDAPGHRRKIHNADQRGGATGMTFCTIAIDELSLAIPGLVVGRMLVLVMADMKCRWPRFMLTIRGRHRPGGLK